MLIFLITYIHAFFYKRCMYAVHSCLHAYKHNHQCRERTPHWLDHLGVGCPRNNHFFLVPTETNRNSICFACFSVCFTKPKNIYFGLFWCFGLVLKQPKRTELCQNKLKKSPKNLLYKGFSKQLIFFSGFEPKLNLFRLFFGFFSQNQQFVFSVCFGVSDLYQNNRNKQNL
jgi:hypothetical protein